MDRRIIKEAEGQDYVCYRFINVQDALIIRTNAHEHIDLNSIKMYDNEGYRIDFEAYQKQSFKIQFGGEVRNYLFIAKNGSNSWYLNSYVSISELNGYGLGIELAFGQDPLDYVVESISSKIVREKNKKRVKKYYSSMTILFLASLVTPAVTKIFPLEYLYVQAIIIFVIGFYFIDRFLGLGRIIKQPDEEIINPDIKRLWEGHK